MSVESRATDPGRRRRIPVRAFSLMVAIALVLAACSGSGVPSPTAAPSTPGASSTAVPQSAAPTAADSSITLYTSVTQNTVDAVVSLWTAANPGFTVEVFRAPTAEVAARIATDLQSGGIQADVLWMTDPLSIQAYADQGLLQAWDPPNAATIDPQYRTSTYFGTRLLNMVMVKGADVTPGPADWADLTSPEYKDAVAMPDPGFAGSAYAALGYFSQAEGYGTDFYQALKDNGTIQVK
ncbi:MAG: extracellular solute-binding protein, partial [Chloroflexi bacterium]|nr:extracellular solute-binding protein [Chloroflexota bacterium]